MRLIRFSAFPVLFILGWIVGSFYHNPPTHYIDATKFYIQFPRNITLGGIELTGTPNYINPSDVDDVYTLVRNTLESNHVAKTERIITAQAYLKIQFLNVESFKCGTVKIAMGCMQSNWMRLTDMHSRIALLCNLAHESMHYQLNVLGKSKQSNEHQYPYWGEGPHGEPGMMDQICIEIAKRSTYYDP